MLQAAQQQLFDADKKQQIKGYWTKRSEEFARQRKREHKSYMADRWETEMERHLPAGDGIRILDVGCGTGFFSFLLNDMGYEVTGIDLTPAMITKAEQVARKLNSPIKFRVMDAEQVLFGDETFDAIVTRNLTWTLPNPRKAYHEWYRVLKPGGVLLNFDANYGPEDFEDTDQSLPENHAHRNLEKELAAECNRIKSQLEISYRLRPAWDFQILQECGFEKVEIDLGAHKRIYREIDEFYNPAPVFSICATK